MKAFLLCKVVARRSNPNKRHVENLHARLVSIAAAAAGWAARYTNTSRLARLTCTPGGRDTRPRLRCSPRCPVRRRPCVHMFRQQFPTFRGAAHRYRDCVRAGFKFRSRARWAVWAQAPMPYIQIIQAIRNNPNHLFDINILNKNLRSFSA